MAHMIPEEFLEQVRSRFDLVEYIGRFVALRRSGRNYFGLCPFHAEKSPSFSVAPDKQMFYCFGCGKGGNLFIFVQEVESLSFTEAVRLLADEAGLAWPLEEKERAPSGVAPERREALYKAYRLASGFYHHLLQKSPHAEKARDYLMRERGYSEETIRHFHLGYAPDTSDALWRFLQNRGFAPELLLSGGLLSQGKGSSGYYDKFRDRVVFPIQDAQGRFVAFGGRIVQPREGAPKYLNSPESEVFSKGRLLYNLHRARSAIRSRNEVVLMEGYMDVVTAVQAGLDHVVAVLGTSLTSEQAKVLRRNAEQVIICYDADNAGDSAVLRSAPLLLEAGCAVKVAVMPQGQDPDAFIREKGIEAFRYEILAGAKSYTAFRLQKLRGDFSLWDEQGRLQYVRKALGMVAELSSAVERDHYIRELSSEFQLSFEALKAEMRHFLRKKQEQSGRKGDNLYQRWNNNEHGKHLVASHSLPPAYLVAEKRLLAWMLHDPEIAERVAQELRGEFNVELHTVLAAHLISRYAQGEQPEGTQWVHTLEDEALIRLVSELSMSALGEKPTPEEVADYIQQIRNYPQLLRIEEREGELEKAERLGETGRAAQIAQEILRMRQSLNVRYRPYPGFVGRREQNGK